MPLAEPVQRVLHDALRRGDTGYPSGTGYTVVANCPVDPPLYAVLEQAVRRMGSVAPAA